MIGWFPAPKKDQLLYDLLSEYHRKGMNLSPQHTMHDLFGSRRACAVFDMPNRLDDLCAQFSENTVYSAEQFIRDHTLFPLYEPFLPRQRATEIRDWMKRSDKGGAIHAAIGQMASGVPSVRFLRYCPECVRADAEQYSEPYWHRLHQITGVCICPEHETWLVETDVAPHQHKHYFQGLTREILAQKGRSLRLIGSRATSLEVAQAAEWLLSNRVPVLGLDELCNRYRGFLYKGNFMNCNGVIKQTEVVKSFLNFYDNDFLDAAKSCVYRYTAGNWLTAFFRKRSRASHPIRHILVQLWLGLEPKEFFGPERVGSWAPFGEGPWPCLNPVAGHHREPTITTPPRIHFHTDTRQPVGTFECRCGYTYRRNGPDTYHGDRFRKDHVIAYGKLWEEKLVQLTRVERRSLRETARVLEVDPGTVGKYLELLSKDSQDYGQDHGASKGHRPNEPDLFCTIRRHRARIEKLVNDNQGASRNEIRAVAPAAYAFLYRHDRDELMRLLPPRRKSWPRIERVDWKRRDEQLASGAEAVAGELKGQMPLVRITISAVGRRLGILALIQGHLDRLPLTKAALEKTCETVEDFQIRRVRYVADGMVQRDEPLLVWKIKRNAGLRSNCPAVVAREIDRIRARTLVAIKGRLAEPPDRTVAGGRRVYRRPRKTHQFAAGTLDLKSETI